MNEKEEEMGEMMKINSPIELENRMKKRMEECGCMPMCGKEEDL